MCHPSALCLQAVYVFFLIRKSELKYCEHMKCALLGYAFLLKLCTKMLTFIFLTVWYGRRLHDWWIWKAEAQQKTEKLRTLVPKVSSSLSKLSIVDRKNYYFFGWSGFNSWYVYLQKWDNSSPGVTPQEGLQKIFHTEYIQGLPFPGFECSSNHTSQELEMPNIPKWLYYLIVHFEVCFLTVLLTR